MSLEQNLHKKMIKMVLGGVAKGDVADPISRSVLDTVKESAKPKIRGIKSFFLCGFNELKRDIKNNQKKEKPE